MPKHPSVLQSPSLKREKRMGKQQPAQDSRVSRMLTINQVADRLQVHRTTVYDFINLSGLKVMRLTAHTVRVDEADLQVWIEQRKAAS